LESIMTSQLPHPLRRSVLLALAAGALATRAAEAAPTLAEAKTQAAEFVKAYGAATSFHTIGRWASPLCINVIGLSAQQGAAVRARVAEVADGVGLTVLGADCQGYNIEIAFTNDPQGLLDNAKKHSKVDPLGDRTSETRDVNTVTLPIQAWYVTNGVVYARNDATGASSLKVDVVYQPAGMPPAGAPQGVPPSAAFNPSPGGPPSEPFPNSGGGVYSGEGPRAFLNVLVIVDSRRVGNVELGVLADYASMLAIAQPRALGQCNSLPSITDLFASCPGRAAPNGLTPADGAYLTALYTAGGAVLGESQQSHVVQRMADLMVNPKVADRDLDVGKAVAKNAECAAAGSDRDRVALGCRFDRTR
jgi:hypothetical protein